jgi:hypothetical protein
LNRSGPRASDSRRQFRKTKNDAKPDFGQRKETTVNVDTNAATDRLLDRAQQFGAKLKENPSGAKDGDQS